LRTLLQAPFQGWVIVIVLTPGRRFALPWADVYSSPYGANEACNLSGRPAYSGVVMAAGRICTGGMLTRPQRPGRV